MLSSNFSDSSSFYFYLLSSNSFLYLYNSATSFFAFSLELGSFNFSNAYFFLSRYLLASGLKDFGFACESRLYYLLSLFPTGCISSNNPITVSLFLIGSSSKWILLGSWLAVLFDAFKLILF